MERQRQREGERGPICSVVCHGGQRQLPVRGEVLCLSCFRKGSLLFHTRLHALPASTASPGSTSRCLIQASGPQMLIAKHPGFTYALGTSPLTLVLAPLVLWFTPTFSPALTRTILVSNERGQVFSLSLK